MQTTLSTATASGAVSLAAIVVLEWILGFWHVSMPADVATAAATLLTAGVHYLVAAHMLPAAEPAPTPPAEAKP